MSAGGLDGVPLTRGTVVLFALLCGGDYDDGVSGCGAPTAKGLARCGFGEQLVDAYHNLHGSDYEEFLNQWRAEIRQELSTNTRGFLPSSRPRLAAAVTNRFPNRRVVGLYLDPITSSSPGHESDQPWGYSLPLIDRLTEFCMRHFNWNHTEVQKQFSVWLWKGVFLQIIYSVSISIQGVSSLLY